MDFHASQLKRKHFYSTTFDKFIPGTRRDHKSRIAELEHLRRSPEGRIQLGNYLLSSIDKHGMVSMAEPNDSVLMWSYYAEGHKGVAVRFALKPDQFVSHPIIPVKVQYSRTFPKVEFYEGFDPVRVNTIIGTKANEWKHEREWRLIAQSRTGYVRMPPEMINGVVLGLRTTKEVEDQIRSWVRQRTVKTDLLRIVNKADSYELIAVTV
jgi:hypothetical protein